MMMSQDHFDLPCECFYQYFEEPPLESSIETIGHPLSTFFESSPMSALKPYGVALYDTHDPRRRSFCKVLFEHTREYACQGVGGRLFSSGMFQLMQLYIRGEIREQNIAWAKISVLKWIIATMPQR